MTLPASPPITLSEILSELSRYSAGQSLSGATDERNLSGVASGAISFSDYLGKETYSIAQVYGPFGSATNVTVGTYQTGQVILFFFNATSNNGASLTFNSVTYGGDTVTLNIQHPFGDGSSGGNYTFGTYAGTKTSGNIVPTSAGGNGNTIQVTAWRVVPYTAVHDTGDSTTLDTVANKGAVLYEMSGPEAGTFTVTVPTDGSAIDLQTGTFPNVRSYLGISFT